MAHSLRRSFATICACFDVIADHTEDRVAAVVCGASLLILQGDLGLAES